VCMRACMFDSCLCFVCVCVSVCMNTDMLACIVLMRMRFIQIFPLQMNKRVLARWDVEDIDLKEHLT